MFYESDRGHGIIPDLYVKTLEGLMGVPIGDYIIKGIKGEIYSCDPEIFAETYEEIE